MSFKLKQALSLSQEEDCRTLDNEGQESRSSRDVDRGVGRTGTNYGTYIAINEYSKRMEDELDMMPGDKIEVITDDQEYNDGWYYGRNLRTGQEGLYPRLFTQEISVDQPSPAVMRAKSTNRPDSPLSDKEAVNSQLDRPNFIDAGAGGELSDYGAGGRVSGKTTNTAQQNSKNISVKSTMSDIDRALEELRGESLNAMNVSSDLAQQSGNFSAFSSANDSSTINRLNEDSIDVLDAYNWTPEQVTAYMIATGFDEESASKFQQHKVSGNILLELELAHLKELEINSFGTRFEMFKEIEALKEMIMRSQFSTNSASNVKIPSSADDDSPALSNQDTLENLGAKARSYGDRSRSYDSTPVLRQMTSTPRLRSSVLSVYETSPVGDSFMSPRKAPVPPPYPSPVQPPKSPNVVGKPKFAPATFHSQSQPRYPHPTIYEQQLKEAKPPSPYNATNHRRSSSSGKNHLTGYFENPELPNPYMAPSPIITEAKNDMSEKPASSGHSNNSNSANRHKKSKSGGSFIELFNRISMLSSPNDYDLFTYPDELTVPSTGGRPTSSIYGHSKTASGNQNLRPPAVDKESKKHRRNSSILSFLHRDKDLPSQSHEIPRNGSLVNLRPDSASADEIKYHPPRFTDVSTQKFPVNNDKPEISSTVQAQSASVIQDNKDLAAHPNSQYMTDEQRRSVSAKEHHAPTAVFYDNRDESSSNNSGPSDKNNKNSKRSISDAVKSMRRLNTTKGVPKKQTSAFTEGIRSVTVGESIKDASCSGWMSKKGAGAMGVWKNRFFTLHGTRLSYFSNTHDTRERGLIDITSHRVLPAKEDDKFVALYAASVGKGRYCFKLVPPAPGSRKGLTFTQPRVHYFAVDSKEEMRTWMAALMKATIDIDPTVPVISSCATPTVSLSRAQEMFSQALEETYKRDENMLKQEDSEELYWEQHHNKVEGYDTLNGSGSVNSSQNHSNNNAAAVHGVESPYTDFDSPAGSSSTTKNPQNYRFSFESPAVNSGVGEYFRLDPKFLPDKI